MIAPPRAALLFAALLVGSLTTERGVAQESAGSDPFGPQPAGVEPFGPQAMRSIQVRNADGSKAAGDRVLVGDPNQVWTILKTRKGASFDVIAKGSMPVIPPNPEPVLLTVNKEGQLQAPVRTPLLVLGENDEVGFVPSDRDATEIRLRQAGQVVVNLQGLSYMPGPQVMLVHWQPGYARPTRPNELGYGQPDLHGTGWKFVPDFEMYFAAPMKPAGDLSAGFTLTGWLRVPPGEVRVTIVPAEMLAPSGHDGATSDGSQDGKFEIGDISAAELRELLLAHGPSRIVTISPGSRREVSIEGCVYSLELKPVSTLQSLPEWGGSLESRAQAGLRLVRDVKLPGNSEVIIAPGSLAHESLLLKHQSERSQIPAVRIGRLTPRGTYRFDLLCPGTYRIDRLGQPLELVRRFSWPLGSLQPSWAGDPQLGPLGAGGFGDTTTHGIWEIEADLDDAPNQFIIDGNDEVKRVTSDEDAVGMPVLSPSAEKKEPQKAPIPKMSRDKQLDQLSRRIETLQRQLDAARELVEELEAKP